MRVLDDASGGPIAAATVIVERATGPLTSEVLAIGSVYDSEAMSHERRQALVGWARRRNAWIVEDDYDGEFRYAGSPLPALASIEPSRVIYVGTFSKVLSPSLRLGYVVAPDALMDVLLAEKACASVGLQRWSRPWSATSSSREAFSGTFER